MRIVELNEETKDSLLEKLLKRSPGSYGQYEQAVNEIISQVRSRGDAALSEYTLQFDKCHITAGNIRVTREEIREAYEKVEPAFVEVMKKSAANIIRFHEKIGRAHV